MAFIQDITAIIDEVNYEDPRRLKEILQSYKHKKKDGFYIVKETYEHLEKLVDALPSPGHPSISIIIDEGNYEDPRRLKEILQSYKHMKKDGCYIVEMTFEQLENLIDILRSPRHQSISVIIDEGNYEDRERLKEILQSYKHEKKDGCYRVKGTFEHLEKLIDALRSLKYRPSSATHGKTFQQDNHVSTHAKHLDVSGVVMDYINQKCADKLQKIQGTKFVIKIQPVHSQSNSLVRVTFKPQCDSFHPSARLHGDFVRQQFITFYQRTASDLQVTPVHLSSHECVDLQRKFPHLLFKPSNGNYQQTAMGPFAQIAKLNEFLSQNIQTSSKSPVNKVLADTPSSRTLCLSPTCSKDPEEETCPICMDSILTKDKKTLRCKHSFCKDCLKRAFDYKPVCPTCGEVYGTLIGTQPDGGKMTVTHDSSSLLGYEKYGTIIIDYHIPSGIQKEEHPNPGQPYVGVSRRAYIPDSSEGRMILQLLRRAFDQRLIFTIGRSTTSGRNNMVTWNDIHHKTSTHGGPTHYGYPDPDYLNRVRDELKVKGIE